LLKKCNASIVGIVHIVEAILVINKIIVHYSKNYFKYCINKLFEEICRENQFQGLLSTLQIKLRLL